MHYQWEWQVQTQQRNEQNQTQTEGRLPMDFTGLEGEDLWNNISPKQAESEVQVCLYTELQSRQEFLGTRARFQLQLCPTEQP